MWHIEYHIIIVTSSYIWLLRLLCENDELQKVCFHVQSMIITLFPSQEFSQDMLSKITAELGNSDTSTSSK